MGLHDKPLVSVVFKIHETSRVEHHGYLTINVELHLEGFKGYGGLRLRRRDLQSSAAALNLTAACIASEIDYLIYSR